MHWIRTSARTCFGYKSIRTEIGRLMHIRLIATDEIFYELTIDSCLQVQLCTQNLCSNWKIASIRLAHFPKWQVPKWQITIIATFFGQFHTVRSVRTVRIFWSYRGNLRGAFLLRVLLARLFTFLGIGWHFILCNGKLSDFVVKVYFSHNQCKHSYNKEKQLIIEKIVDFVVVFVVCSLERIFSMKKCLKWITERGKSGWQHSTAVYATVTEKKIDPQWNFSKFLFFCWFVQLSHFLYLLCSSSVRVCIVYRMWRVVVYVCMCIGNIPYIVTHVRHSLHCCSSSSTFFFAY